MRALIAFDKFKDALTAREACDIAAEALSSCQPSWDIEIAPLADGGDGFCDTLTGVSGGTFHRTRVTGPLGNEIEAEFGIISGNKIQKEATRSLDWNKSIDRVAIIEMAASSGIALTPIEKRSPWTTTSAGLGELIKAAEMVGAQGAVVGLGGSATHDLALGALWKLGYRFLDAEGEWLQTPPTPDTWSRIQRIQKGPIEIPYDFEIRLACDVENPLLGPEGAAAVFGPQKGLSSDRHHELETATQQMAALLCNAADSPEDLVDTPGAGAAGGAAFGLSSGLGAKIVSGYGLVKTWIGLGSKFERADIVLTGEGRFDRSSLQGKGPGALSLETLNSGKRLKVFAGSLGALGDSPVPIEEMHAISPAKLPLSEALAATRMNLARSIRAQFGA